MTTSAATDWQWYLSESCLPSFLPDQSNSCIQQGEEVERQVAPCWFDRKQPFHLTRSEMKGCSVDLSLHGLMLHNLWSWMCEGSVWHQRTSFLGRSLSKTTNVTHPPCVTAGDRASLLQVLNPTQQEGSGRGVFKWQCLHLIYRNISPFWTSLTDRICVKFVIYKCNCQCFYSIFPPIYPPYPRP